MISYAKALRGAPHNHPDAKRFPQETLVTPSKEGSGAPHNHPDAAASPLQRGELGHIRKRHLEYKPDKHKEESP